MSDFQCPFCQGVCKSKLIDDEFYLTKWWACDSCNAGFQTNLGNKVLLSRFYANLRNRLYCLDLRHDRNQTDILLLPEHVEDTVVIVLSLNYIIEGISPSNASQKLETYITFS